MFWSAANIWRATGDVSVLYTVITWAFSYLDVKSDISVLQPSFVSRRHTTRFSHWIVLTVTRDCTWTLLFFFFRELTRSIWAFSWHLFGKYILAVTRVSLLLFSYCYCLLCYYYCIALDLLTGITKVLYSILFCHFVTAICNDRYANKSSAFTAFG